MLLESLVFAAVGLWTLIYKIETAPGNRLSDSAYASAYKNTKITIGCP